MKQILIASLLIFSTVTAQTNANVGMSFLKVAVDARAAALGNAFTASTDDANALYWNPAGLARADQKSIVIMHNAWLVDIFHEFAAVQISQGKHNLGVGINWMRVPGIELRGEQASEEPDGETTADFLSLGLAYATVFSDDWYIGVQLKYLHERYYLEDAAGFAVDLGVIRPLPIDGLLWGLSIQNLGSMGKVREQETKLPLLVRTGLNYQLPLQIFENQPTLSADLIYVRDDVTQAGIGAEVGIYRNLSARTGLLLGHESTNITAGVGIYYTVYEFAYAFVPFQNDLGDSHRFSLKIVF
jgi:hypothetical protein